MNNAALCFIINESVIEAVVDGEALLLNVETGIYFGLDLVGARIWKLLGSGATPEEIVDRLLSEYEAEPEQVRVDVGEFLGALVSRGLIQEVNG